MSEECIKTQNGAAYPEMELIDDTIYDKVCYGGGGNQGLNKLGQPYATSAIGSGPMIDAIDDNAKWIRKDTSFAKNMERTRDRTDRRYDNPKR